MMMMTTNHHHAQKPDTRLAVVMTPEMGYERPDGPGRRGRASQAGLDQVTDERREGPDVLLHTG